ncbi:MAG: hypothetical protein M9918_19595 [Anaerolineae bacterium]|nr:hypothetical protein [Anaerolineae bacterium]MCO5195352.1 hypothetical protein [Anaerolineae bacterium]
MTKSNREYVSKGVSARPEWWERVEEVASEMGINRSLLIRLAVDHYLKGSSANTEQPLTQTA